MEKHFEKGLVCMAKVSGELYAIKDCNIDKEVVYTLEGEYEDVTVTGIELLEDFSIIYRLPRELWKLFKEGKRAEVLRYLAYYCPWEKDPSALSEKGSCLCYTPSGHLAVLSPTDDSTYFALFDLEGAAYINPYRVWVVYSIPSVTRAGENACRNLLPMINALTAALKAKDRLSIVCCSDLKSRTAVREAEKRYEKALKEKDAAFAGTSLVEEAKASIVSQLSK